MIYELPLSPALRTQRIKITCFDLLAKSGKHGLTVTDLYEAILRSSSPISMITTRLMVANVMRAGAAAGALEAREEMFLNAPPSFSAPKRYWIKGAMPCL